MDNRTMLYILVKEAVSRSPKYQEAREHLESIRASGINPGFLSQLRRKARGNIAAGQQYENIRRRAAGMSSLDREQFADLADKAYESEDVLGRLRAEQAGQRAGPKPGARPGGPYTQHSRAHGMMGAMDAEMRRQAARPWMHSNAGLAGGAGIGGLAGGVQGWRGAQPEGWRGYVNQILDMLKEHLGVAPDFRFDPSMKERFGAGLHGALRGALPGAIIGSGADSARDLFQIARAGYNAAR